MSGGGGKGGVKLKLETTITCLGFVTQAIEIYNVLKMYKDCVLYLLWELSC